MKKKMMKMMTIIISVFALACFIILPASAVTLVPRLSDEDFAKAEEFIEADDRIGLYDFLYEIHSYPYQDHYFIWFTTNFTGSYILDDDSYNYVLEHYVFPIDLDNLPPAIAPAPPTIGDVNMDGKISINDIILVNKISVGAVLPNNMYQAQAADVDGSTVIDNDDVILMMQIGSFSGLLFLKKVSFFLKNT